MSHVTLCGKPVLWISAMTFVQIRCQQEQARNNPSHKLTARKEVCACPHMPTVNCVALMLWPAIQLMTCVNHPQLELSSCVKFCGKHNMKQTCLVRLSVDFRIRHGAHRTGLPHAVFATSASHNPKARNMSLLAYTTSLNCALMLIKS
jgi:hypothetical protein